MPVKKDKDGVIVEITLTDDEEEELDEIAAAKKKAEEEEQLKERKERQATLESIHVFICIIIICGLATGTVFLKLKFFPDEKIVTFHPLPQKVKYVT